MMKRTVVFLHTVSGLKPLFDDLLRSFTDQASTVHIADETLIHWIVAAEGLTRAVRDRVREHVLAADRFGAEFIQFTCSSISPCARELSPEVKARILAIDGPMARDAVERFASIGVIATNPGTLKPSAQLLRDTAAERAKPVRVEAVLCPGAYAAYLGGDLATHDRIVTASLRDLMTRVQCVVLAQASMARLADALPPGDRVVPVLSSPAPAMQHLARMLNA